MPGELSSGWGELSFECGASCLVVIVLWGKLSLGELCLGRVVRNPAGAHFVVALSKSHLPCLVLVEPRKRWTDDRLGQTVTRLEITLCLMC